MRYIFASIILFLSTSCFSTDFVTCYNNGHVIYQGFTDKINYIDDNNIYFEDSSLDMDIFVWAQECVIQV